MVSVTVDRILRTWNKRLSVKHAAVAVLLTCLSIFTLNLLETECPRSVAVAPIEKHDDRPTYMLHGDNVDGGYLRHVRNVLERLGFDRVTNSSDFNLLWSHVYPFGERAPFPKAVLQNLKPYQKVNHFPGSSYFTNKVDLATTDLKHVPQAFHLPSQKSQLLKYAKQNPNHLFVQKSNSHRGIKILKISHMNLDKTGTFVQEFVQNPLLIDGYKFDVGIYTILTSVDPLRVYIYDGDALLRFCPKKYEPFDVEDVDKYVVGDDYIPIWEMPSLNRSYVDLKFGMKKSLNIYLKKKGKDPNQIWNQIEESISAVFLAKEHLISDRTKYYKHVGNFFEMVRFDFVVDSDLDVYLMEANMSPNLSSEHFPQNRLLYESVLYNLFSLVGIGRRIRSTSLGYRNVEEEQMEIPLKKLTVFDKECSSSQCRSCGSPHCALCYNCLTSLNLRTIKQSYLEHVNRVECKRIFPPSFKPSMKIEDLDLEQYSPDNRFMILWFLGKCQDDSTWC